MRCEDLMKRDVESVMLHDTVQIAARRMRDANVGFLPVCEDSKVVGTVTDRDVTIRAVAEGRPLSTPVAEIITREVVSCRPEDEVIKAEELMAKSQKSRIMCLDDDGRLVGVISLSDLAAYDLDGDAVETLRAIAKREV